MRAIEEKDKKIHLHNLVSFYSRQEDVILRECVYRHKTEIGKAIELKDTKMEYVYRCHLEAVKRVLLARK